MDKCPYGYTVPTEFFIRGAKECPLVSSGHADPIDDINRIKAEMAVLADKLSGYSPERCEAYVYIITDVVERMRRLSVVKY